MTVTELFPRAESREQIIQRARDTRENIEQIFADAERWNRVNVPWKGEPIDPDPDGQLRRIADGIDKMLEKEPLYQSPLAQAATKTIAEVTTNA